ncbi:MAG: class I SAM-dependent methyltransferase [Polyangiaceae bacterium]
MLPPDPETMRRSLVAHETPPPAFRAALASLPFTERDAWLDRVLGLEDLPADTPDLPRGCVPYLPCSADTLMRMVDLAEVKSTDTLIDIGSGLGRAMWIAHFLTGARAIGVEIQPALAHASRALIARLNADRLSVIEGDAAAETASLTTGTVFFLYCPFSGPRLDAWLTALEPLARARPLRICTVDLPLPERPWLTRTAISADLEVYRTC